jgi:hypothetical protein
MKKFFDIFHGGKVVGYVKHDPELPSPWVAIGVNHRIGVTDTRAIAEDMVIKDFEKNA